MKKLWDWMTWRQLGQPEPGRIREHAALSYTGDKAVEMQQRLESVFGDLSQLSCLDLGCGPGQSDIACNVLAIPWRRLISIEAFLPYVNQLRQKTAQAQRHEIHEIRIEQIFEELSPGEADVVLLMDVLEHFSRREALRLLTRLEKFVRRGIIIFAPLGHTPQDNLDGNALQRHRSFWEAGDLARLGYNIEIYHGYHITFDPPAAAFWAIKKWAR